MQFKLLTALLFVDFASAAAVPPVTESDVLEPRGHHIYETCEKYKLYCGSHLLDQKGMHPLPPTIEESRPALVDLLAPALCKIANSTFRPPGWTHSDMTKALKFGGAARPRKDYDVRDTLFQCVKTTGKSDGLIWRAQCSPGQCRNFGEHHLADFCLNVDEVDPASYEALAGALGMEAGKKTGVEAGEVPE